MLLARSKKPYSSGTCSCSAS